MIRRDENEEHVRKHQIPVITLGRALDELEGVKQFCTGFSCRRKQLLKYFQEKVIVFSSLDVDATERQIDLL